MLKYFILVFGIIFVALGAMYVFVGVPRIYSEVPPVLQEPTIFNNNEQSIAHVHVTAFYFVPKDKESAIIFNWKALLQSSLSQLEEFHTNQFRGRSHLSYSIHHEPVIGVEDSLFYDTVDTSRGNPNALRGVALELDNRLSATSGGRAKLPPDVDPDDVYHVTVIVYEGVGASASENVAFISKQFVFEENYLQSFGITFLTHEFYHTLGLSDNYEQESGITTDNDIMGIGRFRPLATTYIRPETLAQMGI